MSPGPCRDCRERFMGCHGRTADGTWRCEAWGRWQAERAGELERTAGARLESRIQRGYLRESRERLRKMKESGRSTRG